MRNPYTRRGTSSESPNLDQDQQYQDFLNAIQQGEVVWSIAKNYWTLHQNDQGKKAMLIWNNKADAQRNCLLFWQDSEPKRITRDMLFDEILPYLEQQHYLVAINRNAKAECIFVAPERIRQDGLALK
ncbi:DUF2750 domain-containing protein [Acinetobacter sp. A3.8]|uniref:DUF2750 domain-containing protein n=1 Tax=Acinetobacter sedimenti TaxID=2919922 RepID=A0A9X1WX71_9GAMM|nr:DUF2750 domain-containing protein [Acinetobacter sedimenti]MCJ8146268.1 DUF2750 domain-containing protein [Acinetobacter sedimenti]